MRRKDREIQSHAETLKVMKSCGCRRLGPADAGLAYLEVEEWSCKEH